MFNVWLDRRQMFVLTVEMTTRRVCLKRKKKLKKNPQNVHIGNVTIDPSKPESSRRFSDEPNVRHDAIFIENYFHRRKYTRRANDFIAAAQISNNKRIIIVYERVHWARNHKIALFRSVWREHWNRCLFFPPPLVCRRCRRATRRRTYNTMYGSYFILLFCLCV